MGSAFCNPVSGRCELRLDAGIDAGDASGLDAGDAGDAGDDAGDAFVPCAAYSFCPDPLAPICDPSTHQCRPCAVGATGDAECGARSQATPVCESPSGACVECTDSVLHCEADPAEPVCDAISHECRACSAGSSGDSECAARSLAMPLCEGTSGTCVECTDSALHCNAKPLTPICDGAVFACRGCSDHAECIPPIGGGVCEVSSGHCLSEAEVIYVDVEACPGSGTGTLMDPFCSLQDGVDAAAPGRSTLLVQAGTYEPISAVDTGTIWIVGEAGTQVGTGVNQSIVYVSGDVDLTLEGLRIYDAFGTGVGVECVGSLTIHPAVTLRGCTLTNNSTGGVSATSCTLTLDGNNISGNPGGGVSLSTSSFTIVNNFIVLNGSPASPLGGVSLFQPQAGSTFEHNTVVGNDANGVEGGVVCYQAFAMRSSIVAQNSGGDLSANCTATHSFTTANGDPAFIGGGDYHLAPGSPCIDAGDPASTLDHDVDGQVRPQGAGPDIGADESG